MKAAKPQPYWLCAVLVLFQAKKKYKLFNYLNSCLIKHPAASKNSDTFFTQAIAVNNRKIVGFWRLTFKLVTLLIEGFIPMTEKEIHSSGLPTDSVDNKVHNTLKTRPSAHVL